MNKNKFKSIMAENGDTIITLAQYLGISKGSLSKKLNEKSGAGFTQPEIMKIKERYKLKAKDIDLIFFSLEVS